MKEISTLKGTAAMLFLLAITCSIMYQSVGSFVTTEGLLIEPFYLVGIGSFSLALGIVILAVSLIKDVVSLLMKKQ